MSIARGQVGLTPLFPATIRRGKIIIQ